MHFHCSKQNRFSLWKRQTQCKKRHWNLRCCSWALRRPGNQLVSSTCYGPVRWLRNARQRSVSTEIWDLVSGTKPGGSWGARYSSPTLCKPFFKQTTHNRWQKRYENLVGNLVLARVTPPLKSSGYTPFWHARWWQWTWPAGRSSYPDRSWRKVCFSRLAAWSPVSQVQSSVLRA